MPHSTFFPNAHAAVIGLPNRFDLKQALQRADEIRLATAFAHPSGWNLVRHAIDGKQKVQLLTGLYFCQTDPNLLDIWLRLSRKRPNIEARVFSGKQMFHPKVLIVMNGPQNASFALVGSGNLSRGGFISNVECWLYTEAVEHVQALTKWFNEHFGNSKPVTPEIIKQYRPKYKRAQKASKIIGKQQRAIEEALTEIQAATLKRRKAAINAASRYMASEKFARSWAKASQEVARLRSSLDYPYFNFSKQQWAEFYANFTLGHLIPIYRDRLFKKKARVRAAFAHLIDDTKPAQARLSAVVNKTGSLSISRVGLNTVSKVLACHDRKTWPVYNGRVEAALDEYGYHVARTSDTAVKYLAFREAMLAFMKDANIPDVIALDCFFNFTFKKSQQKK
jgi:HKD family nuclease